MLRPLTVLATLALPLVASAQPPPPGPPPPPVAPAPAPPHGPPPPSTLGSPMHAHPHASPPHAGAHGHGLHHPPGAPHAPPGPYFHDHPHGFRPGPPPGPPQRWRGRHWRGPESRRGFLLGAGAGIGSQDVAGLPAGDTAVHLTAARVGGGLSERIQLFAELSLSMANRFLPGPSGTTSTGRVTTPAVSLQAQWVALPTARGHGLVVHGGPSVGWVSFDDEAVGWDDSRLGLGATFAVGYEMRLGRRFTLVPELVLRGHRVRLRELDRSVDPSGEPVTSIAERARTTREAALQLALLWY